MTVAIDPKVLDRALIESALHLAGEQGWHRMSLVDAARDAGLPVEHVRARYPYKALVLLRLNRIADDVALCGDDTGMPVRETLFDLIMRRFDVFQEHRNGLRSVLHTLPHDPALATFLGALTFESLKWIADCAGIDCRGLRGAMRLQGLGMVWTHAVRAWEKDDTPDLSDTMNALDHALNRAERFGVLKARSHHNDIPEADTGLPDHISSDEN